MPLKGIVYVVVGIALGILFLNFSTGRIKQSGDPVKNAELVEKNAKLFRMCGILMIVGGILRGLMTMIDAG